MMPIMGSEQRRWWSRHVPKKNVSNIGKGKPQEAEWRQEANNEDIRPEEEYIQYAESREKIKHTDC
jgi:hypothetical protein